MIRLTLMLLAGIWLTLTLASPDAGPRQNHPAPVAAAAAAPPPGSLALDDERGAVERAIAATVNRQAPVDTAPRPMGVVTGSRVNLRAGPSTAEPVVGQLTRGTEIDLIDESADGWLRIEREGSAAWIYGRFVDRL